MWLSSEGFEDAQIVLKFLQHGKHSMQGTAKGFVPGGEAATIAI